MVIKHSTVATSPDEEGAEVNKTEWNDDHVIDDGTLSIAKTTGLQAAIDGAGGGAHTTQDWTVQSSSPSDPSAGTGTMYVKTIDDNNQGLFIKMKKNGSIVEVQVG